MESFLILKIAKYLGAVLAVFGAGYSLLARNASEKRKRAILILWMIGPPVFFYFEYLFQAPRWCETQLQRFNDLQRLAGAIWAGVVAALSIAYFKKD